MDRKRLAGIFASLALGAASSVALGQGGPPMITDDPGTPGNGHWEINVAYPFTRTPSQVVMETPHIDLNYGLGDNIQLKCETGWLIGKDDGQGWQDGVNNTLFGVKWRFCDEEKAGFDISTYPQLAINTSSDLRVPGLVESGTSFFLPVEFAKTFGKLGLDAEFGYQYYQHQRDQLVCGFVAGYHITEKIELLAEVHNSIDNNLCHDIVIINVGAHIEMVEHVALICSIGRGLQTRNDVPNLLCYAGFQFTF